MNASVIQSRFNTIDPYRYPVVQTRSWDEIYGRGDNMAPGGLYLASTMAATLDLSAGDTVLDLACGRGDTSVFLARQFDVRVVAVDLWVPASRLAAKFNAAGVGDRVVPLQLDARAGIPFADGWFDAIFCMQALHSFGGSVEFLRYLLSFLRPEGRLSIGQTCFNTEPVVSTLPSIYTDTGGWNAEYDRYHSPPWWRTLFEATGIVDVIGCDELDDGRRLWEDEALYSGHRAGWTDAWLAKAKWLLDQLLYGQCHEPYLTHLLATVTKRPNKLIPSQGAES